MSPKLTGLLILVASAVALGQEPQPSSQPLSPAEELAKFVLAEPELKIELAAAEPEVIDPVAIRFDERGRMWVVEMRDYPLGPPPGEPPLSRIKILEDRDFNGTFETATIFADKLSFVTGLQPWKGGVIVTLAGRIAWMKDSDDDGKMDVDETWYTGFAEQNSQLRANHPRLALDNHVYVANGLKGGTVVNKRLPNEPPISLQGRDFRFDPLTGKAESISGNGQFGMCFDNWGNRFTCTNRNPVIHVVLEDRYLKLAPKIPIPAVVQDVAAAAEKSKVYPISRAWTTSNLHAGTFTAACGVHVYRGDTLSKVLGDNSVFTCDPTGNFVHREVMKPDGPSFTSTPAYEGKEFLASTDEWFRPVSVETGPDGCLYIVDMYRCVIEHPDFVPDELKKRPDLRLGDDKGRIWRITPKTGLTAEQKKVRDLKQFLVKTGDLKQLLPSELVTLLDNSNAWHRETAQRLLLEDKASRVSSALQAPDHTQSPLYRTHVSWLMLAHGLIDQEELSRRTYRAPHVYYRQLFLIAEELVRQRKIEPHRLRDFDRYLQPETHFQSLLFEATLADDRLEDRVPNEVNWYPDGQKNSRWINAAVLLRCHRLLLPLFEKLLAELKADNRHVSFDLLTDVTRLIGSQGSDRDALVVLAQLSRGSIGKNNTLFPLVLESLASGLQSRKQKLEVLLPELKRVEGINILPHLARSVAGTVDHDQVSLEAQLAAIRCLAYLPDGTTELEKILNPRREHPVELRVAAIGALAQRGSESAAEWNKWIAAYQDQPLPLKRALIENSFRRADGPALLLEQVKAGVIQPAEIDPLRRKSLLESKDESIKKLAEELFAALNPANRQQALEDYQPVLKLSADAKKGALVFEKNCSTCHRVGEIGVNVAPDISDTRTKTAAQLLADIIQPNRAIDSNFIGYQVLLKDGTTVTGLLSAETSTSLTLKQPGGKTLSVSRDEVEAIKATGVSLMPDGLEKNIPPEAMADLLAYLKNWRYLDGKTPLGK